MNTGTMANATKFCSCWRRLGHTHGEEQFQALLRDVVEPEESVAAIVSMLHQYTPQEVAQTLQLLAASTE